MGIISLDQVDHLYWLGRYTERVYTILKIYAKSFDLMIEEDEGVFIISFADTWISLIYISRKKILSGDMLSMRVFLTQLSAT